MLVSRIGDVATGVCPCPPGGMCPATGIVTTGSPIYLEQTPIARIGDIVMFPCGGFVINMGFPTFIEAGMPVAEISSTCTGVGFGTLSTGAPTFING